MAAQMTIDQAGLSAGVPGRARTDGLATGALVTITNTGSAQTTRVRLLWVPPEDTNARVSLTQVSTHVWRFTPLASAYGSYRIELTTDLGLATESTQIRIFGIRLPDSGLLVPAANESADSRATLENNTGATIAASENNEAFAPFSGGSSFGWWKTQRDLIMAVQNVEGAVEPLWSWNRTDLSQFVTTPVFTSGSMESVNALAFRADGTNELGPALAMSGTWSSGGGAIWKLQPGQFSIPSGGCTVEMSFCHANPLDTTCVGMFFHNGLLSTSLRGYGVCVYDSTNGLRCWRAYGDATIPGTPPFFLPINSQQLSSYNPTSSWPPKAGSRYLFDLRQKQGAVGIPPNPSISARLLSGRGIGNPVGGFVRGEGLMVDGYAPIPGVTWNNQQITEFALGVTSMNSGGWTVEVDDIIIWPLGAK